MSLLDNWNLTNVNTINDFAKKNPDLFLVGQVINGSFIVVNMGGK